MKFLTTFLCAGIVLSAAAAQAGLLITEVVDGTLGGGNPKFVEITNTDATDFTFTGGGIVNQSNAGTDLNIDVDLTGVTILAGQSFVIQSTSNGGQAIFESTYGFAADLYTAAFFSNGDDRYILADADDGSGVATNLVDIHGAIDTDGTGTAWEYTDGYAFRNPGLTSGNGGVFAIGEWTHGGVDSLQDPGFDDVIEAALLVANTSPGVYGAVVPEPASAILVLLGASLAGAATMRSRLG